MGFVDINIAKPLDRLFKDQIREFESGSYRFSDKELKKIMRESAILRLSAEPEDEEIGN